VKIIYFGTPEISARFLKELVKTNEVVAVVTQPDKPARRGQQLQSPPVKTFASDLKIPVFQPERLNDEIISQLKKYEPQLGVVVSYGKLIPEKLFSSFNKGCFNIHFSLLPKYRGAAPIQWALINGENWTGVTAFWLEKTLDTGPVIVQKQIEISGEDDALSLQEKLTVLGLETMNEALARVKNGKVDAVPQEGHPTFAPALKKEDGRIDWSEPAEKIINLVRGAKIWPCAFTNYGSPNSRVLKILKASENGDFETSEVQNGRIESIVRGKGFCVKCGKGFILVEEVHPENKKRLNAWAFWQGGHLKIGDILG
jgi:methionyl-tRNA formyltransferase